MSKIFAAQSRAHSPSKKIANRRYFLAQTAAAACTAMAVSGMVGCTPPIGSTVAPDLVWGRLGNAEGRLMRPRAMTMDENDNLYIVDMWGRIQVFDADGKYLRGWRTPEIEHGKPVGMGMANDGSVMVADTHYFRVLFYSRDGMWDQSRTIGGVNGDDPGQFHFITDVVQTKEGHYYIGHYGQNDQIQEFSLERNFVRRWGGQGGAPGQFSRPQTLLLDKEGLLWVADACNHRIQVFQLDTPEPKLVKVFGRPGKQLGEFSYPYGMCLDSDGTVLISEFGNHRVQRFDRDGKLLQAWGTPGSSHGQFNCPWALIVDSKRRVHVLDSQNHRVQRFVV
jgi:sugar lactone lactonase YvrE